jgi:hypothetical protein
MITLANHLMRGLLCSLLVTVSVAADSPERTRGTGQLPARPPGQYCPLNASDHAEQPTFRLGRPCVGTTYFYWYDKATGAHIVDPDGSDALTTHPKDLENISYKSSDWHRAQMLDMIDAGIDFLMPVFWGYPEDYKTHWSYVGLPPLVRAHDQLRKAGKKPPAIGLFYDTSSIQHNRFRGKPTHMDLSTDLGKDWFYTTIRDFFSMIPPSRWARVDGRPVVFFYSPAFAAGQDPTQFDYVRRRFGKDFGCGLFLVRHVGWQGDTDASYSWGGAISLKLGDKVAGLGPGYDHAAVPGRSPLVVDRRDGAFYIESWSRLLAMSPKTRPFMVHVETWNEWHEGTDIADSKEYGRQYIDLTRQFADRFRNGVRLTPIGAYAHAKRVTWRPGKPDGLDLRPSAEDGQWAEATVSGRKVARTRPNELSAGRYLYFRIDDSFLFDDTGVTVDVQVTYVDAGCARFLLEYDNTRADQGPVDGAFRPARWVTVNGDGALKTASFTLVDGRFANRANGADFRLTVDGESRTLSVAEVTVSRRRAEPR